MLHFNVLVLNVEINCWHLPLIVIFPYYSLLQRSLLAIKLGTAFNNWDELSPFENGTNCRLGRIDAWDELSLFGIWDELSLGTNCRFTYYNVDIF